MEISGPITVDQAHLEAAKRRAEAARTPVGKFLGRLSTAYYDVLVRQDMEDLESAADLENLPPRNATPEA